MQLLMSSSLLTVCCHILVHKTLKAKEHKWTKSRTEKDKVKYITQYKKNFIQQICWQLMTNNFTILLHNYYKYYREIVGQTGFVKFGLATNLGEGKFWIHIRFTLLKKIDLVSHYVGGSEGWVNILSRKNFL